MSIRDLARADFAALSQSTADFGAVVTLTRPDGQSATVTAVPVETGATIDPDTGEMVAALKASVIVAFEAIATAGLGVPEGIHESNRKPWLVSWEDVGGGAVTYKVSETRRQGTLARYEFILERYHT